MVCRHLYALEQALLAAGIEETYRGQPWSRNCRDWVYFDADLDTASLLGRLELPDCVEVAENTDPKSGIEHGLFCTLYKDAVMGNPGSRTRFR